MLLFAVEFRGHLVWYLDFLAVGKGHSLGQNLQEVTAAVLLFCLLHKWGRVIYLFNSAFCRPNIKLQSISQCHSYTIYCNCSIWCSIVKTHFLKDKYSVYDSDYYDYYYDTISFHKETFWYSVMPFYLLWNDLMI